MKRSLTVVSSLMSVYPSIQVEVGLSDIVLENRRDSSLWVSSTNLEVRTLLILNRLIALGKISRWADNNWWKSGIAAKTLVGNFLVLADIFESYYHSSENRINVFQGFFVQELQLRTI